MRITWLGHSSLKIEAAGRTIFVDPYSGDESFYAPADIVLVSQFKFDHCSLSLLKRCRSDSTVVLGTRDVAREVFPCGVLLPGEKRDFDGIIIGAVKASNESVGFLISAENKLVYILGDSSIGEPINPDVLFIPIGGTFSLRAKDAAQLVKVINPKIAIPIHWGSIEGTRDDASYFAELCPVAKVLEVGESFEF